MNQDFINNRTDKTKLLSDLARIHPVEHVGNHEDVASLVAWLTSDEPSFVTGQVWTLDGGRTAKLSLPH